MGANTTGAANVAMGFNALDANTTAGSNTALGYSAMSANTTGANNVALGTETMLANTTGSYNTAVGVISADVVTTGANNTSMGYNSLGNLTTGSQNTSIGDASGVTVTTGNYNTYLGKDCRASATDVEYETCIGYNQVGQGDGKLTYGKAGSFTTLTAGSTTVGASSDRRIKENIQNSTAGLSFINDLQPKIFEFRKKKDVDPVLTEDYEEGSERRVKGKGGLHHGFIAQEVKEAIDKHTEIKEGFDGWEENPSGVQAVGESAFIPMLVKAVQELSAKVEELEDKLNNKE